MFAQDFFHFLALPRSRPDAPFRSSMAMWISMRETRLNEVTMRPGGTNKLRLNITGESGLLRAFHSARNGL